MSCPSTSNGQEGVVPVSGHWVMEENPNATITMVIAFLVVG
jgi:pimeloyl-ACP methyl ester carboxylesterase